MANANVAKKEEKLPALNLSLMEEDANSGLQNISQEDLATPRLKVLMQLSPEIEDIEGAKAGMIFNTVTNEMYDGSAGIKVLPCAYQRQYVEWADRGQGSGAPINVYDASSDILAKTTRDENNKDRLENGNYIETCRIHFILLVEDNGNATPAVLTMKATQLKKSRKWNSMMLNLKLNGKNGLFTPPSYSHYYRLKTIKEGNDNVGFDMEVRLRKSKVGGENWRSATVPFRVEGGIDIVESFIREGLEQKLIKQAGPWYEYEGTKVMGMNGIKKFFMDNTEAFDTLKNELAA